MTTKNKDTNSSMQPAEDRVGKKYLLGPWEFYGMSEEHYNDIAHTYPEHFYSEEDLERNAEGSDAVNRAFEVLLNA